MKNITKIVLMILISVGVFFYVQDTFDVVETTSNNEIQTLLQSYHEQIQIDVEKSIIEEYRMFGEVDVVLCEAFDGCYTTIDTGHQIFETSGIFYAEEGPSQLSYNLMFKLQSGLILIQDIDIRK